MSTTVTTESGTQYEFNADMSKVRLVGGDPLRRDGEWLNFTLIGAPLVGMPLNFLLEPLGEGAVTYRRTTPVVTVEEQS